MTMANWSTLRAGLRMSQPLPAHRRLLQLQHHLAPFSSSSSSSTSNDPASPPPADLAADARNRNHWKFITASAFAGKPPERPFPPSHPHYTRPIDPRFALPASSPIKQWVDKTLRAHPSSLGGKVDGGHDWWFIQRMKDDSGLAMGVADGVGGWVDSGVDPSCVSQGLMYYAAMAAKEGYAGEEAVPLEVFIDQGSESSGSDSSPSESGTSSPDSTHKRTSHTTDPRVVKPKDLLSTSYTSVLQNPDINGGASTSLLLTLSSRTAKLTYSNLGDSQLLVIRQNQIILQPRVQTHFFNCPRQLSKLPPGYPRQGTEIMDLPNVAENGVVQCMDGDLVVAYTDGVGDNVFTQDLVEICKILMKEDGGSGSGVAVSEEDRVKKLAHTICAFAKTISYQRRAETPFELEARQHGHNDLTGGKVDDITVVVALIREC